MKLKLMGVARNWKLGLVEVVRNWKLMDIRN